LSLALLLLTLVLAGAIAVQAYRNFLGHKATAERVLRDYARLAAARFAQRTEMAVYWSVFSPALEALSRVKANIADTPLPTPASLPAPTELHSADFRKLARYTFATTCTAVDWRRRARRRPRACADGCATRWRRIAARCTTPSTGWARSCTPWTASPARLCTRWSRTSPERLADYSGSRRIRAGSKPLYTEEEANSRSCPDP